MSFCIGSAAGSALIKDYENKAYYRACIITQRVVKGLSFKELRVLVDHEQFEINELLRKANEKTWTPFTPIYEEEQRHLPEMERLYDLHAKDLVNGAINKANTIAIRRHRIERDVGLYWLYFYVLKEYDRLREYAFDMTNTMLAEKQKRGFVEHLDRVEQMYGDNVPTDGTRSFRMLREKLQGHNTIESDHTKHT